MMIEGEGGLAVGALFHFLRLRINGTSIGSAAAYIKHNLQSDKRTGCYK